MPTISKLDYVAVPVEDTERARVFYADTLGLRTDDRVSTEFWIGETCLSLYQPTDFGMPFAPSKNGHLALHVDDVDATRAELEGLHVQFNGPVLDTGHCKMTMFVDSEGNDLMLHSRN